ncbi:putative ribonuclease H-like domain-containing protein [Tanacetum coccineum]
MKKMYCLVVTDDYSRFSWVFFLATKDETSGILKSFITGVENLIDQKVKVIRCDNGTEFKNKEMNQFCERKGIKRGFSIARTPQQNRVVERKNRTLIEAAKTMLADSKLPTTFWAEAVNTACYVQNRSMNQKLVVAENPGLSIKLLDDPNMPELEDIVYSDNDEIVGVEAGINNLNTFIHVSPILATRIHKDHPVEQIIGDLNSAPQTRRMTKNLKEHGCLASFSKEQTIMTFKIAYLLVFYHKKNPKSAFFMVKIEEEVYVCQPPGFEDPDFPDRVYKVEKALYGLHQAPRAWYETLSTYLLDNGFQRGKIDKTLFIRRDKGDILLVQVYVDDIIFGSTKKSLCTEFEKMMHKKFQMSSMGELTFFLGLQVKQKEDGIFISQDKYVTEILKKFGFTDVKTASTPMETQKPLLKDKDGEEVDVHLYRSMIGSLMYLTSSRPDIMFAVCACARYQVNPKVSHLHAVKRIFRYLKGQPKLGLWYPKDSPFDLVAYTDSDYARASLDRKVWQREVVNSLGVD